MSSLLDLQQLLAKAILQLSASVGHAPSNTHSSNKACPLSFSGPDRDEQIERLRAEFGSCGGDPSSESALRTDCERASSELDARTSYAASIIGAVYVEWGLPVFGVVALPMLLRQCVQFPEIMQRQLVKGVQTLVGLEHYTVDRQYSSALDNSVHGGLSEGLSQQEKSLQHVLMVRS
jgi:hypothetical protein